MDVLEGHCQEEHTHSDHVGKTGGRAGTEVDDRLAPQEKAELREEVGDVLADSKATEDPVEARAGEQGWSGWRC
jgi:hypothetical protein